MTKKDFIALADHIREARHFGQPPCPFQMDTIKSIADFLAKTYPAFNRDRWMDYVYGYCGKNGGKAARSVLASTAKERSDL